VISIERRLGRFLFDAAATAAAAASRSLSFDVRARRLLITVASNMESFFICLFNERESDENKPIRYIFSISALQLNAAGQMSL